MGDSEAVKYLQNGEYGVLSTIGEDGYPYGVPVNYVYKDGEIFFHCATTGHKLDNLDFNNKVSFCVVSEASVVADEFGTKYRSIIAFGRVKELRDEDKNMVLNLICERFSPEYIKESKDYIKKGFAAAKTYKIIVEHLSGKKAR